LNVLATEFNIPDDVAGATLMAAGASSPELFSSIVSLFVTHSALGLGTIVGSEIFNQLVICAGAVFAAKSGQLKLDAAIVTREVGFYALSIGLLLFALRDKEPADDDQLGVDHIFISFSDALLLAGGYVLYIIVCAYFDPIVDLLSKRRKSPSRPNLGADYGTAARGGKSTRGSFHMADDMPYGYTHKSFKHEPYANFEEQPSFLSVESGLQSNNSSMRSLVSRGSFLARTLHLRRSSQRSTGSVGSFRLFNVQIRTETPSDHHPLYDMQVNAVSAATCLFVCPFAPSLSLATFLLIVLRDSQLLPLATKLFLYSSKVFETWVDVTMVYVHA